MQVGADRRNPRTQDSAHTSALSQETRGLCAKTWLRHENGQNRSLFLKMNSSAFTFPVACLSLCPPSLVNLHLLQTLNLATPRGGCAGDLTVPLRCRPRARRLRHIVDGAVDGDNSPRHLEDLSKRNWPVCFTIFSWACRAKTSSRRVQSRGRAHARLGVWAAWDLTDRVSRSVVKKHHSGSGCLPKCETRYVQ